MNNFKIKSIDHLLWSKPAIVVLSILIAIFIWLFLVDPVESLTFAIPVQTSGLTDQYTIENQSLVLLNTDVPRTVDITVKGRKSYLEKLKKDRFSAVYDFSKVTSENVKYVDIIGPVYDGKLGGARVVDVSPERLSIQVDKLGDSVVQVDANTTGTPKAGYKIVGIETKPNIIQLTGGDSIVKRAVSAIVSVDVSNISSEINQKLFVKVVDASGKELKGTEKKYKTMVNIKVAREVDVIPVLQGEPPAGYSYEPGSAIVLPIKVLIKGNNQLLNDTSKLYTKPINISSFTRSTTANVELTVPEGITLEGQDKVVRVTVPIKGLDTKRFDIQASNLDLINKSNMYTYTVLTSVIRFSVKGSGHSLENLNLTPIVDVGALKPGDHKIKYEVSLPLDCEFVGKNEVRIRVQAIATAPPQ